MFDSLYSAICDDHLPSGVLLVYCIVCVHNGDAEMSYQLKLGMHAHSGIYIIVCLTYLGDSRSANTLSRYLCSENLSL